MVFFLFFFALTRWMIDYDLLLTANVLCYLFFREPSFLSTSIWSHCEWKLEKSIHQSSRQKERERENFLSFFSANFSLWRREINFSLFFDIFASSTQPRERSLENSLEINLFLAAISYMTDEHIREWEKNYRITFSHSLTLPFSLSLSFSWVRKFFIHAPFFIFFLKENFFVLFFFFEKKNDKNFTKMETIWVTIFSESAVTLHI